MSCNFTSTLTYCDGLMGPSLATACSASKFFMFMSLLDALVRTKDKISGLSERVEPVKTMDEVYDFVVVGGGAGGAVVASRLSEITKWKVLLLEAGPDEPAGIEIPSMVTRFSVTELDWNYKTTNESHACLATNGSCTFSFGKMLGGSTAHNHMVYLRGNPTDYNNWADLGNKGWSWEDVEPYFILTENNGEIDRVGRKHHGTNGPMPVERFPNFLAFGNSILAAAEEAGYGISEDLNGDTITGFSVAQTTSKNGVRRSSSRAYLWPVRNRTNLHVSLNSFVTKVIIEDQTAVGVEYCKNGERRRVYVTREVILSASAVGSPHILLLSGIGPKKHLESKNVKVVKDLPGVGENLHDHVATQIDFTINDTDTYDNNWAVAAEYLAFQTGPMSSIGLGQVVGILASDETAPGWPDIQLLLGGFVAGCAPGEIDALRSPGRRTVTVLPTYLHPASRGRISLASNDPFEDPVIQANYLSNDSDVHRLIKGINMTLKLMNTTALLAHDFTLSITPLEACSSFTFPSDQYWACFVRQITSAGYHVVGSCKMGPSSDPMAVVDHRLRVHGIKGLRVADASIMPQITSGNTAAPTMMIGERAADFIKKDLNFKCQQTKSILSIN